MNRGGLSVVAIAITIAASCLLNSRCEAFNNGNQVATLYTEQRARGQSISLGVVHFPNLGLQGFDNQAKSACVTGAWIFYEHENYNMEPGLVEYIYGLNNKCLDFTHLPGKISSARYAGFPSDYKINSLTLYEGDYFQGRQEYTTSDRPFLSSLDQRASSLIVTGLSPWTVYTSPNFQGDAVCVYPPLPSYNPAFIFTTNNIRLPPGTIRSVRLGCFGRVGFKSQPTVTSAKGVDLASDSDAYLTGGNAYQI